jgi:sugar O-acyltransferase (sialic acid O-acetyltransferase NeuD family)
MKIFCIGFNKTGTTSLTSFFRDNGFSVAPETPFELELDSYLTGDLDSISEKIKTDFKDYDFFQDVPFSFPELYKHLSEKFPEAKFILSVRDDEKQWYNSLISYHTKLFGNLDNPSEIFYLKDNWLFSLLTQVYKAPPSNPYDFTSLTQTYLKHNQDARDFFRNTPEKFLEINIKDNDLVEKLENFLNLKFKKKQIPHLNKSDKKKAIFGNGGHAREVASYLDEEVTFFVDDNFANNNCLPISKFKPIEYDIMVALANPEHRQNVVERLPKETTFFSYIHPTSIVSGDVEIGEGSFIGPHCILTTNIQVGNHALLNRGVHIGHDCFIGDFFSCMPGVIISGNNTIGSKVYMGAMSVTKEKISITDNVTVGLNAGVVSDIDFPGTYVDTPTKLLKK